LPAADILNTATINFNIFQHIYSGIQGGSVTKLSSEQVTAILQSWHGGDQEALNKLAPIVYDELHRIARKYMRNESAENTLLTTDLVHEAYIRLINASQIDWHDRTHFFAISAKIMRQILVDHARTRNCVRRGDGIKLLSLDKALNLVHTADPNFIKLDDALAFLEELDPKMAQVVELRFFGGLTLEETAEVMEICRDTVKREWRLAKAWLLREMKA
jgi:RNA polymerase sigma-70 factor, ECF subfamily